jgi:hypothetical protein
MHARSIERHMAKLGRAAILAAIMLTGGCAPGIDLDDLSPLPIDAADPAAPDAAGPGAPDAASPVVPDAGPEGYTVRGAASGVLGAVALELRIDGNTEVLAVTQDGAFSFDTRLQTGASYTVVLVDSSAPCALRNQTGVIAGADTAIELTCTGASLSSVVVSGVAPITLVPDTTDQVVDIPFLQQSVRLTATVATSGDTLSIAGTEVASGVPGPEIVLGLEDNFVDIVVDNAFGWQGTYRLNLRRVAPPAQRAYGKASNTGGGDNFAFSVAVSGDTLAIGAIGEDSAAQGVGGNQSDNSTLGSGAVYVFRRTGATWQQEAYLKASNTDASDNFGYALALSGDTLVVGAFGESSAAQGVGGDQNDDSLTESGAVYVFRRSGTTWQQEAYIKASNTGEGDGFGYSLSFSGDLLAVGAWTEDSAAVGVGGNQNDNSRPDSGAVYVFRRSGTIWQQEAYIKASNTGSGDGFGHSVALSGDTLAVGAFGEDGGFQGVGANQNSDAASSAGAVYVFRRSSGTWQQEVYIKASNAASGDSFGHSVALSGDTLAVGAYAEDSAAQGVNGDQISNAASGSGAVYVFRRSGSTWQQEAYVKASNTGASDEFGTTMALAGDTLAVGAYGEDSAALGVGGDQSSNSASSSGAVYVFRRSGTTWRQDAYVKASNTGANDRFGDSLALSGDTLAVGAVFEDSAAQGLGGDQNSNASSDSGAVYVFH